MAEKRLFAVRAKIAAGGCFCVILSPMMQRQANMSGGLFPWALFGFVWHPAARKYLSDAREQIADLDDYAAETEMPPPSPVAKALAARLLDKIVPAVPRYYGISPWEDGDVVIQANGAKNHSVSVCCRATGGASLYVVRPEGCVHERHYRPPETITAGEITEALKQMRL